MTNPEALKPEAVAPSPSPSPSAPAPAAGDLENQKETTGGGGGGGGRGGVSSILQRWRREDLLNKGCLALRGAGLLFSLLAFLIMATNKHGDWRKFDRFEEYRYVLAIAILSTLYTGLQFLRHFHDFSSGREILPRRTLAMIDFFGDQVVAYLLISAASSAVPLTNRLREGADNIFTDSAAAAISLEFFAFFSLGLSALISGYKLSNQTYI